MRYGSDAIIDWLVDLGITHVALNPGATIRGLHESLVRDDRIETVLALHEEIAVGIAHGYWKTTGAPMAVFVHDLVGAQHASMALFNAMLDRVPMVVIGGAGPRSEPARRPWLDWIHYASSHSGAVRDVVKLAMEPSSLVGVRDSLSRGLRAAMSTPQGPVFVAVDTGEQEMALDREYEAPRPSNMPPFLARCSEDEVSRVADLLVTASHPAIVVDRSVPTGIADLVEIVDRIGASVVDLGGGFCFPSAHWANQSDSRAEVLAAADVVLVIEPRDAVWALSAVETGTRRQARLTAESGTVLTVGVGSLVDVTDVVVEQLLTDGEQIISDAGWFLRQLAIAVTTRRAPDLETRRALLVNSHRASREAALSEAMSHANDSGIHPSYLSLALGNVLAGSPWLLANGIVKDWPRRLWDFGPEHAFLGRSGGEGLGYGMPASLGAALAHRTDDSVVVNLQSDGDLMYTASAFWTAAHHDIPLLTVMYDNGSYGKDELHQQELARLRGRPLDTTHIGIRLDTPRIDFAQLASSQGVESFGGITEPAQLTPALQKALNIVRDERRPALVHAVCR